MKNGRKAAALLAVVLTLLSFCSFTAAGQKAYSLEEAGVSLSLPADLRVLRYPVEEGNSLIPLTGWSSADELNSYYEETGTLLEAYFPDTGACLSVESWSDGESMAIGSFTSQSEAQLLERIADYPFAWQYGEEGQSTASLENRGEQPYLLYTNESEEGILSRYYETVAGGNWFYLSLYGPANGRPLLEEELSALEDALDTLSFLQAQEGAASTSGSWEETVSLALFGVGLLLFLALVLFLARSVRRSRPAPPVLPGFLCRVSTPVGFADLYRDYFVVFPSGRSPLSFWYPQTGGIAETERCFWVYPPNLPPLPLPKDSFLAGSPERLRELLPAINRKAEGQG